MGGVPHLQHLLSLLTAEVAWHSHGKSRSRVVGIHAAGVLLGSECHAKRLLVLGDGGDADKAAAHAESADVQDLGRAHAVVVLAVNGDVKAFLAAVLVAVDAHGGGVEHLHLKDARTGLDLLDVGVARKLNAGGHVGPELHRRLLHVGAVVDELVLPRANSLLACVVGPAVDHRGK